MGNSEVGHLNLGAGAVVKQDLTRIDEAVEDGTLAENDVLREAVPDAERVHLIGLVSDGGVHSGWTHLQALIAMAAEARPRSSCTPSPTGATRCPTRARASSSRSRTGAAGRQRARRLGGRALLGDGPRPALGPHPEGLRPAGPRPRRAPRRQRRRRRPRRLRARRDRRVHRAHDGRRRGGIRPGDSVIAFNFRPDRMREITRALAEQGSTSSTAAAARRSSATRR